VISVSFLGLAANELLAPNMVTDERGWGDGPEFSLPVPPICNEP
jgi:hypothetical protein